MGESANLGPPPPVVQSFVVCREVLADARTGQHVLIQPASHVAVPQFPCVVMMSLFAEFTSGHGRYEPQLQLRDADGEVVWKWGPHPRSSVPTR